jgi:hypothetical protein
MAIAAGVLSTGSAPVTMKEAAAQHQLQDGSREFGLSVGYSRNLSSSRTDTRFTHAFVDYGKFRSTRQQIILEGTFFDSNNPVSGNGAGVMGVVRYHFSDYGRVIPFVQVGLGALHMNFRLKEQASGFQFQQKLGVGVRCAISKRHSVDCGAERLSYFQRRSEKAKRWPQPRYVRGWNQSYFLRLSPRCGQ